MRGRGTSGRDLLAAALTFASTTVWVGAAVALMVGRLSSGVALVALGVGLVAGGAAARRMGGWREGALTRLEVLALGAFALVSLRQFGWLLYEEGGSLLTLLPYNYGDLPLHWTYTQYLANGAAFWPENPIVVGERLRYPLGVDLLAALGVVLGGSLRVILPSLGLAGAFLAAWALRRWGGALAVAGFLFAGGLAGFQALWTGRLLDYQNAVAWKNLYLALFVPQRGLLLALPVGLVLLWSARRRLLRGEEALPPWVEGILWGALPLVHLHTFLLVSVVVAVWALGGGRLRAAWPSLAWAVVPATWGVWQVSDGFRAASLLGWHPGWVMEDANPLWFLLLNFGLFLPLAAVAWVRAWRHGHREDLLVLGPALVIFAGLFFVRLAPWAWDNTKVMLWCYLLALPSIQTQILAPLGRPWRVATLVGLLFSGAVSVTAASIGGGARLDVLDLREYEAVCESLAERPLTERVVAAPTFNHPVALCGHPLVLGYPGHVWSHGSDASYLQKGVETVLRGEPGWRVEAQALGADLLFWGRREATVFPDSTRPWETELRLVASGSWGRLYALE